MLEKESDYTPVLFSLKKDNWHAFQTECQDRHIEMVDSIMEQLMGWVKTKIPGASSIAPEFKKTLNDELSACEDFLPAYGNWVYYPWRHQVIHLLPQNKFEELRCNRNHNKILPRQQKELRKKALGVIGLSVGYTIALNAAQEGLCGEIRIADFDRVELSNLNRLRTSVLNLGKEKSELLAREISELDPYMKVVIFKEGLTEHNVRSFIQNGTKLDAIVEECDNVYWKVRLRELAKEYHVPVIMETNDRGMVDIERYDSDPHYPIFHGLLENMTSESIQTGTPRLHTQVLYKIIGGERAISAPLRESLQKIGSELVSYPQLASDVLLGGALVGHILRRLFCEKELPSGRFYIDLSQLITKKEAYNMTPHAENPGEEKKVRSSMLEIEEENRGAPVQESDRSQLSRGDIQTLCVAGSLAPSGGNLQPWQVLATPHYMDIKLHPARSESFIDIGKLASYLAIGAFYENVSIAAAHLGFSFQSEIITNVPEPFIRMRFQGRNGEQPHPLYQSVYSRCTNRKLHKGPLISYETLSKLEDSFKNGSLPLSLKTVTTKRDKEIASTLLGKAEVFRLHQPDLSAQLFSELRWSAEETQKTKDGIDLSILELPKGGSTFIKVLHKLHQWKKIHWVPVPLLEGMFKPAILNCSHLCVLSTKADITPVTMISFGQYLERLWLTAEMTRLSIHPLSILPFFLLRTALFSGQDFTEAENQNIKTWGRQLKALFKCDETETPLFIFRLSKTDSPPTGRSLRVKWDDFTEMRF